MSVKEDVVALLRRHQTHKSAERLKGGPAWADSGYLFTDESGAPLHPHSVSQTFDRRVKAAGVKRRFHDLRHTAATLMLRDGVRPKVVAEMLGHADVSVTMNVCSHSTKGMHEQAAATLGSIVLGGSR